MYTLSVTTMDRRLGIDHSKYTLFLVYHVCSRYTEKQKTSNNGLW